MNRAEELYLKEFGEWLHEQKCHTAELESTIKAAEEKKLSNEKQLSLHKERINLLIQDHNVWAANHGLDLVDLT
ncbi:MAG: hypothetical protein WC373_05625 [Smithella sp.]|jgi:hypothetical protein